MRLIRTKRAIVKQRLINKKPKPLLYPASIEIQYRMALKRLLLTYMQLYIELVEPNISMLVAEYKIAITKDSWEDLFSSVFNTWKSAMDKAFTNFKSTISKIATKTVIWNSKQWDKHMESALGKSLFANSNKEELKKVFINKETEKVAKLSNELYSNLNLATIDNVTKGSLVNKDLDPFVKKAKLLSTLGISELNTELYKDQQLALGIDEYIWRTMRDEKVRNDHRSLEGKICSWKDPTIFKYTQNGEWQSKSAIGGVMKHVGEDYNCRCYPEANFSMLV